jgi:hypothetical protein
MSGDQFLRELGGGLLHPRWLQTGECRLRRAFLLSGDGAAENRAYDDREKLT